MYQHRQLLQHNLYIPKIKKSVHFNEIVYCKLIPSLTEYKELNLINTLWWSISDMIYNKLDITNLNNKNTIDPNYTIDE